MAEKYSSGDVSRPGSYGWFVVGLLWCVCFLNYADRQAIFSVFSVIREEFRLSDVQLGVVAGCFMWAYAAVGPFAGWISDRVSRSRLIIAALCFWSLCTAATAYAPGYRSLLLLRTLGGLGEAFYFPAAMSLLAAYHGQATRSRAMALHQSSVYLGTIAGGTLSAYVAERAGWRIGFVALGACGVLLAALLVVCLRDPASHVSNSGPLPLGKLTPELLRSLTALARNNAVLVMIAVFVGANFVAVVFMVWMPTFLLRKFNMQLGVAGFSGTAYLQVASVAGVIAGGFLADILRRRTPGGRQLTQAIGLLGGVSFLFFTGYAVTLTVLFTSLTGYGFFKGLYDSNIWASLYDFVPVEQRGLATGLMNSLGWLGAGFAPIAFALASTRIGSSACVSLTAVIYLVLTIPLAILVVKRGRAKSGPAGAAA